MDLYHLNIATFGREPLFIERAERRALLRVICRIAGPCLWLFGVADDHFHAVVRRTDPGVLAGHLHLGIESLPRAPRLQRVHIEPVTERSHLRTLVPYVVKQSEHHDLGPTVSWEGSCFRDLVGARRIDGFDPRAWRNGLPREDSRLVWAALGLQRPAAANPRGLGLADLVASASRVTGAHPALSGREPVVVRARRVAAALAREAGFPPGLLAEALGCSPRAVRYFWGGATDPADLAAAKLDLAIEAAWGRRLAAAV